MEQPTHHTHRCDLPTRSASWWSEHGQRGARMRCDGTAPTRRLTATSPHWSRRSSFNAQIWERSSSPSSRRGPRTSRVASAAFAAIKLAFGSCQREALSVSTAPAFAIPGHYRQLFIVLCSFNQGFCGDGCDEARMSMSDMSLSELEPLTGFLD